MKYQITNPAQLEEALTSWSAANPDTKGIYPLVEIRDGCAAIVGTQDAKEPGAWSVADLQGGEIAVFDGACDMALLT